MKTARSAHTATLLPSGEVLVVGGESLVTRAMLASVELFDPDTSTWRTLAPLPSARSNHTASLLPDGRVLIVGGGEANDVGLPAGLEVRADAVIYDPETGASSAPIPMLEAREFHQAVTLASGDVLVVGGANDHSVVRASQGDSNPQPFGDALASAEIFDVASGSFRAAASLTDGRYAFTATALADGRVLVSGGASYAGGTAHSFASSEIYDPASDAFTPAASFDGSDRLFQTATRLADDRVLVFGGKKSNVAFLGDLQVFSAERDAWDKAGTASSRATGSRVVPLEDGGALLVGGYTCSLSCEAVANVDVWSAGKISQGPPLAEARANETVTVLADGSVLVAGGFDAAESATAERLTP
jgi:hypothetical protein